MVHNSMYGTKVSLFPKTLTRGLTYWQVLLKELMVRALNEVTKELYGCPSYFCIELDRHILISGTKKSGNRNSKDEKVLY